MSAPLRFGTPLEAGVTETALDGLFHPLEAALGPGQPGFAAVLALHGIILAYRAAGTDTAGRPLTLDRHWDVGSFTTVLTVEPLFHLLVEDGLLDPEAEGGLFPEVSARYRTTPLGKIPRRGPGGSFWPRLLGRLDGRGFSKALEKRLFEPVGMRPSVSGEVRLRFSPLDLALYLEFLRLGGRVRTGRLLAPERAAEIVGRLPRVYSGGRHLAVWPDGIAVLLLSRPGGGLSSRWRRALLQLQASP